MKTRTARIADYVSGDEALPPTFTTAYKRDLDVAREMIQQRRHATVARQTPEGDGGQSDNMVAARALPKRA